MKNSQKFIIGDVERESAKGGPSRRLWRVSSKTGGTKKKITSFIFSFLIAAIILAFAATAALAQGDLDLTGPLKGVGGPAGFNTPEKSNLPEIIGRVIQGFLSMLGIIFMGYIIYGGSLWITARGEEEKITRAKAIIRGSVIGLIIVFAAYAITAFVLNALVVGTSFEGSTV